MNANLQYLLIIWRKNEATVEVSVILTEEETICNKHDRFHRVILLICIILSWKYKSQTHNE